MVRYRNGVNEKYINLFEQYIELEDLHLRSLFLANDAEARRPCEYAFCDDCASPPSPACKKPFLFWGVGKSPLQEGSDVVPKERKENK